MVYSDRIPKIRHIGGGEFKATLNRHTQSGVLDVMALVVEQAVIKRGFSPNLGWFYMLNKKFYLLRRNKLNIA